MLDTQIAIWFVAADARLSQPARFLVEDQANGAIVSTASIWEIAIKFPLMKRRDAPPFSGAVALSAFHASGFPILLITPQHVIAIETLPPMHADPFDRLLLAQAITDGFHLLTADAALIGLHPCVVRA